MTIPLHVLLVEDTESDAELALNQLAKAGFMVTSQRVETAVAMKAALDKAGWDIIISDYSLPNFSASAALGALLDSGQDIPFIVVSGSITEESAIGLMRIGAADYLMKDRLARLGPLVRRELNIAQVRRERNESREELQKSQDWSNLIYNLTSDAMFLLAIEPDGVYRCLTVNSAYLKSTGFAAEQVVGKRADEVIPPEHVSYTLGKYQEAIRAGQVIKYEETAPLPWGLAFVDTTLTPIFDQSGKCTHLLGSSRDITDRKRAENILKKSELYLRSILNTTKDGFWMLDAFGKVIDANQAYSVMSGYALDELKSMRISDLDALEEPAMTAARIQRVISNGSEQFETRHRRKDGSLFDVEISATYLAEAGGRLISFCRDISERKRIEESLRLSVAKYSTAFRISPDAINITRLEGGLYIETNEGFSALTGFTVEDVHGKTSLDINIWGNPQDRTRFVLELSEKGSVSNFEAPFRRKDGTIRTCLVSARLIDINGEKCILSNTHDITNRKQAEQALRESEFRYRLFFEQGHDGVVILNPETGQIIEFNDLACRQLGYSREEFARLRVSDIEAIESAVEVQKHIQYILTHGGDEFETQQRTRQGEIRNVHVTAQLIETGSQPIYHCIWRDITESKRAEEQLNLQLSELRRWHTVTLGREKRILELKNEVNHLLQKGGLPPRYNSSLDNSDDAK